MHHQNESDATRANGLSRREMLGRTGVGFGTLALAQLLDSSGQLTRNARADVPLNPFVPRQPHFPAKAKRVIHLFMNGGPSQVDTFDPKPALAKYADTPLEKPNLRTERKTGQPFPSPFKFQKYGESGIEVSDLFTHTAKHVDEMCVIRSMHADVPNHEPSLLLMNCGEARLVRPSMGSWLTYGLGTDNANLPGFVVMCPGGYPVQDSQNWQCGFLPGVFQGTHIDTQHTDIDKLIANIRNQNLAPDDQRRQLDFVQRMNSRHLQQRPADPQLEARIQSLELAYRMQSEASEAFDVSNEPQYILDRYGPGTQARQILIARRLVERGVRFVQVWHGAGQPWDSHNEIGVEHARLAKECDQAIGALLSDLKERGMLEETLVIWGGEFGRTPTVEVADEVNKGNVKNGRDHNHYGFTYWMAGGGVRGGYVHGATDELGFQAVEDRVHVHDLHATILKLMGFDHERFTYHYAGRDFRLTDVHGRVVERLLA
jgi:hypothetical protein